MRAHSELRALEGAGIGELRAHSELILALTVPEGADLCALRAIHLWSESPPEANICGLRVREGADLSGPSLEICTEDCSLGTEVCELRIPEGADLCCLRAIICGVRALEGADIGGLSALEGNCARFVDQLEKGFADFLDSFVDLVVLSAIQASEVLNDCFLLGTYHSHS